MPATVVALVCARSNGVSAISFLDNVWEWWRDSAIYSRFLAWAYIGNFDGVFTVELWPWGPYGVACFFLGREPHVKKMDA